MDHRSYRVNFAKIEALGYRAQYRAEEVCDALACEKIENTDDTVMLDWYKLLIQWHKRPKEVELYDGILEI